jgi:putative membrane protein
MAVTGFFDKQARDRAAETVKQLESNSSIEVVIAVRRRAAPYLGADYLGGFILALATLCALMFLPQYFAPHAFPLDVTIAFVLGALGTSRLPLLERMLTRPKIRRQNVRTAARAALFDLGVTRTRRRTGLLVYVAMLEREVELVADIGVALADLGDEWTQAAACLAAAVRGRADPDAFFAALAALGPLLTRAAPPTDDDINELPDEVDVG